MALVLSADYCSLVLIVPPPEMRQALRDEISCVYCIQLVKYCGQARSRTWERDSWGTWNF